MKYYQRIILDLFRYKTVIYVCGFVLLFFPVLFAGITGKDLSYTIGKAFFVSGILLFILGKSITLIEKKREYKGVYREIGPIIAWLFLIVLIIMK